MKNEKEINGKKAIFSLSESRFMRFLGGNDLIYALIALVLLGIVILSLIKFHMSFNHLLLYLIQ